MNKLICMQCKKTILNGEYYKLYNDELCHVDCIPKIERKIELYEPSNATCFEIFSSKFCDKCKKNPKSEEAKNQCMILGRMLFMKKSDKGYPKQLIYKDEKPVCTSFVDREQFNASRRGIAKKPRSDKLTLDLF